MAQKHSQKIQILIIPQLFLTRLARQGTHDFHFRQVNVAAAKFFFLEYIDLAAYNNTHIYCNIILT